MYMYDIVVATGVPDKIGVHIPGAVTVNSPRYLAALWAACQELIVARDDPCGVGGLGAEADGSARHPSGASPAGPPSDPRAAPRSGRSEPHPDCQRSGTTTSGSFLRLEQRTVESLDEVEAGGGCDVVIVANGAAAAAIAGVPAMVADQLELAHVRAPGLCVAL